MVMDKGKVLIVDDEPDIREGFRHILDWDGMGLTIIGTASSGEEALPIIRSLHPDIVLSDIVMNGMSGLDLIERAADEGIEAQFILISGYNEFKYAQKAIALGASMFCVGGTRVIVVFGTLLAGAADPFHSGIARWGDDTGTRDILQCKRIP